jgi:N-acetylglucosaminyl-diphospho-decaprenol L-rhamnosyltransferase
VEIQKPTLSIVIVTYNVAPLLRRCLESICASQAPFTFETIVVDTGRDGSAAMVRRDYPMASVLEAPENPGYAAANNLGLRGARGECLLLLNPDTVLPPDALARAVAALQRDPSVGVLGVKLVRGDGRLDLACRRSFPTPRTALYHFLRLPKLFPSDARFGAYNLTYRDPDQEYDVDSVAGAFMLLRREVLDQVGLLDETYWMYGEDLDLCWRAKAAGWRTRYVPSVRVTHLKGESSRTRSLKCTYEFFRAMHLFYWKHYAAGAPAAQNALVTAGIVAIGAASLAADRLRPETLRRVS